MLARCVQLVVAHFFSVWHQCSCHQKNEFIDLGQPKKSNLYEFSVSHMVFGAKKHMFQYFKSACSWMLQVGNEKSMFVLRPSFCKYVLFPRSKTFAPVSKRMCETIELVKKKQCIKRVSFNFIFCQNRKLKTRDPSPTLFHCLAEPFC